MKSALDLPLPLTFGRVNSICFEKYVNVNVVVSMDRSLSGR